MNCAYAELNENVKRTTTDSAKHRVRKGSSNASERSLSPTPSGYGFRSWQQSAVAATKDAVIAIARCHHTMAENERFNRMMEMSAGMTVSQLPQHITNRSTNRRRE